MSDVKLLDDLLAIIWGEEPKPFYGSKSKKKKRLRDSKGRFTKEVIK